MRRSFLLAGFFGIAALTACPQSAWAEQSVKRPASPPPVRALAVATCSTTYGAGSPASPFVAQQLATTTSLRGLSFYSNGRITVLGPAGWSCGALVAADGGQTLAVYPPGRPNYSSAQVPKGAAVIQVEADYTGHLPGAELVCGLFPGSAAAGDVHSDGMPCPVPPGQKSSRLTPDVVLFNDGPGTTGTGSGSGGSLPSVGAAVYPQLASADTTSVNVSVLSCTLSKSLATLCPAIRADYLARTPPAYVPSPNGG
jgi:hypothetical protein